MRRVPDYRSCVMNKRRLSLKCRRLRLTRTISIIERSSPVSLLRRLVLVNRYPVSSRSRSCFDKRHFDPPGRQSVLNLWRLNHPRRLLDLRRSRPFSCQRRLVLYQSRLLVPHWQLTTRECDVFGRYRHLLNSGKTSRGNYRNA